MLKKKLFLPFILFFVLFSILLSIFIYQKINKQNSILKYIKEYTSTFSVATGGYATNGSSEEGFITFEDNGRFTWQIGGHDMDTYCCGNYIILPGNYIMMHFDKDNNNIDKAFKEMAHQFPRISMADNTTIFSYFYDNQKLKLNNSTFQSYYEMILANDKTPLEPTAKPYHVNSSNTLDLYIPKLKDYDKSINITGIYHLSDSTSNNSSFLPIETLSFDNQNNFIWKTDSKNGCTGTYLIMPGHYIMMHFNKNTVLHDTILHWKGLSYMLPCDMPDNTMIFFFESDENKLKLLDFSHLKSTTYSLEQ